MATESGFQNPLESVSNALNPIYSLVFDTEKEAREAFDKELSATSLTKCCDLDFCPTNREFCTNCCALLMAIDDDEMLSEISESSDYYWIE